jgi:hypothetical protein
MTRQCHSLTVFAQRAPARVSARRFLAPVSCPFWPLPGVLKEHLSPRDGARQTDGTAPRTAGTTWPRGCACTPRRPGAWSWATAAGRPWPSARRRWGAGGMGQRKGRCVHVPSSDRGEVICCGAWELSGPWWPPPSPAASTTPVNLGIPPPPPSHPVAPPPLLNVGRWRHLPALLPLQHF